MNTNRFNYLVEKIMDAPFIDKGFPFLYIEEFFSKEDFDQLVHHPQIRLLGYETTEELITDLKRNDYDPVPFPGTVTDINEYLKWYNTGAGKSPGHTHGLIEGFGLVFRMKDHKDLFLKELVELLNSAYFQTQMMDKFNKQGETRVETAIQKYLHGYEISPHPDIRKKCLTYMVNINPYDGMEDKDIHTHFMTFTKEKEFIAKYWDDNPLVDRCWVPWDWCETQFIHTKNNSITMFAPSNRSIHAIKLNYDHCPNQRTQIYGNLWYPKSKTTSNPTWRDLC